MTYKNIRKKVNRNTLRCQDEWDDIYKDIEMLTAGDNLNWNKIDKLTEDLFEKAETQFMIIPKDKQNKLTENYNNDKKY